MDEAMRAFHAIIEALDPHIRQEMDGLLANRPAGKEAGSMRAGKLRRPGDDGDDGEQPPPIPDDDDGDDDGTQPVGKRSPLSLMWKLIAVTSCGLITVSAALITATSFFRRMSRGGVPTSTACTHGGAALGPDFIPSEHQPLLLPLD